MIKILIKNWFKIAILIGLLWVLINGIDINVHHDGEIDSNYDVIDGSSIWSNYDAVDGATIYNR